MNAHKALIAALAGNAPPYKPDAVLSQAVENLKLEAEALAHFYSDNEPEIASRLWYLSGRCAALETFVDCLAVRYHRDHEDAFAFDETEEKSNGAANAEGSES